MNRLVSRVSFYGLVLALGGSSVACYVYKDADRTSAASTGRSPSSPSSPYPSEQVDGGVVDDRSDDADSGPKATSNNLCDGGAIDRFKELMIIDRSVVGSANAMNMAARASWSFRRQMEVLAGSPALAPGMTMAWLTQWKNVAERPAIESALLCPWLRQTPANHCDAACAYCDHRDLDLSRAPFRLLAIVNRIDLRNAPGADACGLSGGEGRLVYTAEDPTTRSALPFTVIFEYRVQLNGERDLHDWAQAWHGLSALEFGTEYNTALSQITDSFATAGALRRVRTNEVALGSAASLPWEMREFALSAPIGTPATLSMVPIASTPPLSFNKTAAFAEHLRAHRDSIEAGDNALTLDQLAQTALVPTSTFRWEVPGADPRTRTAFSMTTCSGCHAGERGADPLTFQHIAPGAAAYYGTGVATQLSRFLHNPGHDDELSHREKALREAACTSCARPDAGDSDGGYGAPSCACR